MRWLLNIGKRGMKMIKIDLITGFLGAGKTTFLKKYAKYLLDKGERICIIENDFGAINVDMVILQDIASDKCNLEMIVGGDGREAHQRRLKTKLIAMGMNGYDRVIIEPSGIFDLDEFFDVLYEEPLDRWYEIDNVIAIVDSKLEKDITRESRYLLMSEAASAGTIILSKLESTSDPDIEFTEQRIKSLMEEFKCSRVIKEEDFIAVPIECLDDKVFNLIVKSGYNKASYPKEAISEKEGFQTIFYFDYSSDAEKLIENVRNALKNEECGKVHRIKGFVQTGADTKVEINATRQELSVKDVESDRTVLIIIGEQLNKDAIKKYFGEPSL